MKVEIKINNEKIMAVNKVLQVIYKLPSTVNKIESVYRSIGLDLADKFDNKYKSKVKKSTLFDNDKKTKFSFKFHEAWALHAILMELIVYSDTAFESHQIQSVINTLDQKLA